jgi:hypothetical protein
VAACGKGGGVMAALKMRNMVVTAAAFAVVIGTTVGLADLPPPSPWQRFEADAPSGTVEVRPMPPGWKKPPVWNGYFGDDRYGNYHPKGAAPAGWVHPRVLETPKEVDPYFPGVLDEQRPPTTFPATLKLPKLPKRSK